jgi:hypothetical protein
MDGTLGRRYAQGRRGENEGEPVTWRRTTELSTHLAHNQLDQHLGLLTVTPAAKRPHLPAINR